MGAAIGLVLTRAGQFPESVPAMVSPLDGSPTTWAPGVLPIVMRVPLMGAGLLLAVSGIVHGATLAGEWIPFFRWLAIALTVKTCLETVSVAIVGTPAANTLELPLHLLTLLVVALFVIYAFHTWRNGRLTTIPTVAGRAWLAIGLGLAVWLTCAMLPSFY
jgi:hypothetical protein